MLSKAEFKPALPKKEWLEAHGYTYMLSGPAGINYFYKKIVCGDLAKFGYNTVYAVIFIAADTYTILYENEAGSYYEGHKNIFGKAAEYCCITEDFYDFSRKLLDIVKADYEEMLTYYTQFKKEHFLWN